MDSVVYNIPAHLAKAYRHKRVILRAQIPAELDSSLSELDLQNVLYCQLLQLDTDIEPLTGWNRTVPLDLVMTRPEQELPLLYRFSSLLSNCATRVSVPVTSGFAKAVRLALALNFAVKLKVGQPDDELVTELNELLDLYLHRPTVSQPVEYFHSVLLSFYHQQPHSLWFIQEEDPEQFCFVSDDGTEGVSERLNGLRFEDLNGLRVVEQPLIKNRVECDDCEFFNPCGGYFKWPNPDFSCTGVKLQFGTIRAAAEELRADVDRVPVAQNR